LLRKRHLLRRKLRQLPRANLRPLLHPRPAPVCQARWLPARPMNVRWPRRPCASMRWIWAFSCVWCAAPARPAACCTKTSTPIWRRGSRTRRQRSPPLTPSATTKNRSR
jgi:hypothetical protein